jgi:aspartyl-tRNA(Asn)/glutamyl-tRNA(Gln) amidotransferase subunit B
MRSKEESHDYRYFPDPDLPEFVIDPELVAEIKADLPELPARRLERYARQLGLPAELAVLLSSEPELSDYFDQCVALDSTDSTDSPDSTEPAQIGNYIAGSLLQIAHQKETTVDQIGVPPAGLLGVLQRVHDGTLSHQAARKVLTALAATGHPLDRIVKDLGLAQISDREALLAIVDTVLSTSDQAVTEFREGKQAALNSLIGGVMKATKGKANPNLVRELLLERLNAPPGH